MLKIPGWDKLPEFYYLENLVDFVLNFNGLFYKKFLEIMFISNYCPNLFQVNEFRAKVT